MYLEKSEDPQNMTVSQDVKNPTAQLKGLLGIGGTPEATPVEETPVKNNKKDTHKKDTPKSRGSKKNRNKTPKASRDGQANPSSNQKSSNKKRNKNKPGQPPKENFAWSSFQSSPDASALPMPAFISPENSAKLTAATAQVEHVDTEKLSSLLRGLRASDEAIANAPRAEDLEAEVIAKAQQDAAAKKERDQQQQQQQTKHQQLQKTTPPVEQDSTTAAAAAAAASTTTAAAEPKDEPVSSSGINLAALASSPPPQRPAPPSAPANTPVSTPTAPRNTGPPLFTPPSRHGYGWNQHHQQLPYMGPSSGYITIQVQVPPVLMPGRRMMVTSPAGYPVQIAVPDGIPPGMIIPVNVPTAPIAGSPYGGYPNNGAPMHYPMYPFPPPHR